jgi:hypothetical protein
MSDKELTAKETIYLTGMVATIVLIICVSFLAHRAISGYYEVKKLKVTNGLILHNCWRN